jgi:hypothetical protein
MTLYQEIETQIMRWANDGTKTAGSLTREIMKLVEEERKREIRDIKIELIEAADDRLNEGARWAIDRIGGKI